MRKAIWIVGVIAVVLFAGMQFHRPNFDLSPVDSQATFEAQLHPAAHVQSTLRQSCYNCHSAEARIPWYGHVWPASTLIEKDIREGRAHLDFSNWSNLSSEMSHYRLVKACKAMREAEMPLWYYRPMHPGSAPKSQDVEAFCAWVQSQSPGPGVAQGD